MIPELQTISSIHTSPAKSPMLQRSITALSLMHLSFWCDLDEGMGVSYLVLVTRDTLRFLAVNVRVGGID